jgi:serine/threonine-protein kinase
MGEVYRATDSVLQRPVAVKLLSERYASDPDIRARFEREALTAARLSGARNVITVFDVGEHGQRPFIVMEYVEGGSVHDRLRHGPVRREQALDWLEQTARALDQAHASGVVHRDVKPANLLLDADENVHVSDFGIASAAGLDTLTLPGTVLGTAGYLSPEQAQGEAATPASDRYALGAVAFELLTGRRPFESETAATEAFAHVNAPVPSATKIDPRLSPRVDAVLERALAKDPDARPATATALVGELRTAIADAEAPAPTLVVPRGETAPVVFRRSPLRSRWALVMGATTVLLAALAVAGILGIAGGGSPEAGTTTTSDDARASLAEGTELNDVGFARMEAGNYSGALPPLVRAVEALRGSGILAEAYARYNLAFTRFALGHCSGVLTPLERSEAIQGRRAEIDELRGQWNERCAAPPPAEDDDGKGKGNGKGKGRDKGDEG